jgi:predicted dehydrogenase/threonine dehydrogenase-like Zn-dependent dehydrogenase
MKQLLQFLNKGKALVADVPAPAVQPGCVLVEVVSSLVSAGTERAVVEFAGKSLLQKARSRPDLVRQVLDKAKREGALTTWEAVWNRLDRPMALGYSCAGNIVALGAGVTDFQVGEAVACAGGGYAAHAEIISVPQNLVVKLPDRLGRADASGFESAAFTTLGAIALQGVRLAEVKLGEVVAVIGLGLVGQLTVQILQAAGCRVIGMDIQPARAQLALKLGADAAVTTPEEMHSAVLARSGSLGADAVLITADTHGNEPVELAGVLARERAVIVAVGAVGMTIPRKVFYEKELDFRISRSYGPGRYDPAYEEHGHDYPIGYVRWTENRNMQAFVNLMATSKVDVRPLITHRFPIQDAAKAYDLISGKTGGAFLGVLIEYPGEGDRSSRIELVGREGKSAEAAKGTMAESSKVELPIGLVGAGNFANGVLLPALKRTRRIEFVGVAAATGLSARHCGDRFGFKYCTTEESEVLTDARVGAVFVATRHHQHSHEVVAALNAGKHVFVEKPLALNEAELSEVIEAVSLHKSSVLMVGFNRRFSPFALELKRFFTGVHEPLTVHYRANAGYLPPQHWTQDPAQGGGRIIGEACHFVDIASWLIGEVPVSVECSALPDGGRYSGDNVVITLAYPNGSLGVITYLASGDKALGKERMEVHGGGRSAVLDDFRRLELVKEGRRRVKSSWLRQDKGHRGECEAFVRAVQNGGPSPISFKEIVATTRATFAAVESLRLGARMEVHVDDIL